MTKPPPFHNASLVAVGTRAWRARDPLEVLRDRYVYGFDTLGQFERKLELLLREGRS